MYYSCAPLFNSWLSAGIDVLSYIGTFHLFTHPCFFLFEAILCSIVLRCLIRPQTPLIQCLLIGLLVLTPRTILPAVTGPLLVRQLNWGWPVVGGAIEMPGKCDDLLSPVQIELSCSKAKSALHWGNLRLPLPTSDSTLTLTVVYTVFLFLSFGSLYMGYWFFPDWVFMMAVALDAVWGRVKNVCKQNGLLILSVLAVIIGCLLGFFLRTRRLSEQVSLPSLPKIGPPTHHLYFRSFRLASS